MTTEANSLRKPTTDPRSEDELIAAAMQQETARRPAMPPPPERIGPYRIGRRIGAGGMGVVYQAEQERPIRRTVALKVIKLGMDTREVVARFEAERQALALMNHAGIARVYDAGATDEGRPYFAMEYVKGTRITQYCDQRRLSTAERLGLFVAVCQAVQHAHQKGVIHRDIKPSNVLVTLQDERPVAKVIDFGVAKATAQRLSEQTLVTEQGQFVGTPEYMSPEQAGADVVDIDTRTDVYSLGVLLYELLVGRLPFDSAQIRTRSVAEMQRIIREQEPLRPSTRVHRLRSGPQARARGPAYGSHGPLARARGSDSSSIQAVASHRRTDPRGLCRALKGDLDWITLKALEKDRARRYASPSELAADIERHLKHEPVAAGPPSAVYRTRKFIRRNRGLVIGAAAVFVVLMAGIISTTIFAIGQSRAMREARWQAYVANIRVASSALAAKEVTRTRRSLEAAPPEFRNWEWHYLNAACDTSLRVLRGHTARVDGAAFSSDGRRLASAAQDHLVHIWNLSSGEAEVTLSGHERAVYNAVFSPDDKRVATASRDGTVRIWDSKTGEQWAELRHDGAVWLVAYSPDGSRLASASSDRSVRIWDAATGELIHSLSGHKEVVYSVAFSPDGQRLASATNVPDNAVYLWNATNGERLNLLKGHTDDVSSVAFSPDGTLLASGSKDHSVRLWNPATGELIRTLRGHKDDVSSVAFNSDGSRLASASWDKTNRLWDPVTGDELAALLGHDGYVMSVAFGADDALLASTSWDKTVRIWDARPASQDGVLRRLEPNLSALAVSADGTRLAAAFRDGTVRIWDAHTNEDLATLRGHDDLVTSVSFNPEHPYLLVTASRDCTARFWDLLAGTSHEIWKAAGNSPSVVTFSLDGRHLALATESGDVRILDGADGRDLDVGWEPGAGPRLLAFSPDGAYLTVASGAGQTFSMGIWSMATRKRVVALLESDESLNSLVFSPDGKHLAGASKGGSVPIWDTRTGKLERALSGHEHEVRCVAYNPNGSRLASGSLDGTVRVWDPGTGDELIVLRGHEQPIQSVAFSSYHTHPDRARLITASNDGVVRVWETVPQRIRFQDRLTALAIRATAEPIVDALWRELNDAVAVADRLRSDAALSEPVRRAALNLVLQRVTKPR